MSTIPTVMTSASQDMSNVKETTQTNALENVIAALLTSYTAALTHLITHPMITTTPLEKVKSSTAMTGAAQKIQPIVMENVFLMLLECHLDSDLQPLLMDPRSAVRDKTAAMLGKPTSSTYPKVCHTAVPWMKSLTSNNMKTKECLPSVVAKTQQTSVAHTTQLLSANLP